MTAHFHFLKTNHDRFQNLHRPRFLHKNPAVCITYLNSFLLWRYVLSIFWTPCSADVPAWRSATWWSPSPRLPPSSSSSLVRCAAGDGNRDWRWGAAHPAPATDEPSGNKSSADVEKEDTPAAARTQQRGKMPLAERSLDLWETQKCYAGVKRNQPSGSLLAAKSHTWAHSKKYKKHWEHLK